jgi:hypothetical protein
VYVHDPMHDTLCMKPCLLWHLSLRRLTPSMMHHMPCVLVLATLLSHMTALKIRSVKDLDTKSKNRVNFQTISGVYHEKLSQALSWRS